MDPVLLPIPLNVVSNETVRVLAVTDSTLCCREHLAHPDGAAAAAIQPLAAAVASLWLTAGSLQ